MTDSGLIIHYRQLMLAGWEWEECLENAVESLQPKAGAAQVRLTGNAKDALLHFFIYPASAHEQIKAGSRIQDALTAIEASPETRIVLASCALTTPALQVSAVVDLAEVSLLPINKKYAIRSEMVETFQSAAVDHIRLVARQIGLSLPSGDSEPALYSNNPSLLDFEDSWESY